MPCVAIVLATRVPLLVRTWRPPRRRSCRGPAAIAAHDSAVPTHRRPLWPIDGQRVGGAAWRHGEMIFSGRRISANSARETWSKTA